MIKCTFFKKDAVTSNLFQQVNFNDKKTSCGWVSVKFQFSTLDKFHICCHTFSPYPNLMKLIP